MASGMVADFARMPTQRKVLVFVCYSSDSTLRS